jgi:hypothetical protein
VQPKSTASDVPDSQLRQRIAVLERERDALREDLGRSQARVRTLEKSQAHVRDRLAWALDTLHSILQGKS